MFIVEYVFASPKEGKEVVEKEGAVAYHWVYTLLFQFSRLEMLLLEVLIQRTSIPNVSHPLGTWFTVVEVSPLFQPYH
jgi:hypothetical protein